MYSLDICIYTQATEMIKVVITMLVRGFTEFLHIREISFVNFAPYLLRVYLPTLLRENTQYTGTTRPLDH